MGSICITEAFVSRETFVALLTTTGPTMISGVEGSDIDRLIELDRQSEALLVAPQFYSALLSTSPQSV